MQNESQNIEYKKHSSYPRNHNIAHDSTKQAL